MSSDLTSDLLQFNFTMPKGSKNGMFSFDRFRLDAEKLMLYRDGVAVTLPPKIVKTLAVLIENRGTILSKDELIEKVWDDSIVEESNLSQNLYILRKTLGSRPDGGQYIETLRRRGYRFNADVESHSRNEHPSNGTAQLFRVPLIGREKEIDEVAELLSREEVRLVTISGVGGVGKTTLAKAVAEKFRGTSEVFFIELAAITRPELVLSMIAASLGIRGSGDDARLDRIKETLADRSVLLVIDNFEQVASAAQSLADLLNASSDRLKILVTSRVALRIKAESTYVVPPLQTPEPARMPVSFTDIASFEAVNLYVERAKQAQPEFELLPENAADVANICSQLGGLPLAIEIAAARMRFMSPEAVLKRLRKQLDFLQGSTRDAPPRQQTMRETISWSYDLLTDEEKQVFARLAVFSGGFDLPAAEFVCAELNVDSPSSVLNIITSLVEHNLLAVRNARNGEPRIFMLEVLREFADEVLTESGELEAARSAHALYFVRLGEEAEPQLLAARSAEWLDHLETEHDNLRAALMWAIEHDPAIGQRLAGAVWRFWWLHGHIREACEQLGAFLDSPGSEPKTRAKMLVGATFLNRLAGNPERSRIYAEEGVGLASSTGDLRTAALSLNQLGFLALDVNNFSEAERMFERGLKRAEELRDIQVLALLNNGLGELSRSIGDYKNAADYYGRALRYNREAGDRVRQTTCLINLGATALMQNDRKAAGEFYRNGLEISSEMEDMNGTLYCLEGIAGSYWAFHDAQRASLIFGAAHTIRQKNGLLLEPADQVPYRESVSFVRESLGTEAFNDNFSKGTGTPLQAAVALALDKSHVIPKSAETREDDSAKPKAHTDQVIVERHDDAFRLGDFSNSKEVVPHVSSLSDVGSIPNNAPPPRSSRLALVALSALILVLAAIVFVLYKSSGDGTSERTGDLTIVRLTNGDFPMGATISNDGNLLVFHTQNEGTFKLYVQQVGQPTKLELASFTDTIIYASTFSPDGQSIYFLASDQKRVTSAIYRISIFGGRMMKVIDSVHGPVSFSPDGNELVFARLDAAKNEGRIVIADKDGRNERIILTSTGPDNYGATPAWSPDGKMIAITKSLIHEGRRVNRIDRYAIDDGTIHQLSNEYWDTVYRMAWLPDGRGLAIIATREDEGYSTRRDQVYIVTAADGKSRRITTDGNRHEIGSLGVAGNGAILAVFGNRSSQLWSMDVSGDQATAIQLSKGLADGRAGLCALPDGRIAYIARTGDDLNIWIANGDGSDAKQLVTGFKGIEELRAEPKGRFLIFSAVVDGKNRLFRTTLDGGDIKQITFGEGREIDSSVSPDGESIAYGGLVYRNDAPFDVVFTMPASGGEPKQLTDFECMRPSYSPNGEMISCVGPNNEAAIISTADRKEIKRIRFPANSTFNYGTGWLPDSSAITLVVNEKTASNIWVFPIAGFEPRRLTNFTSAVIYRYALSPDGTHLYLARGYPEQDAELITNYK
jgi:predicted ATPase/Tol biopolymer transport system component/DNA-binding winged helix-turn-helix (wHTH) protein